MTSSFISPSRETPAKDGRPELVALDQRDALGDIVDPRDALSTQDALTEIARAIVGRSSAFEVAQVVVEAVRRLVPSERSAVWAWLPERDSVQLLAAGSIDFDVLGLSAGDVIPLDDGSFRAVVEQGVVQREADLSRHQTPIERALSAAGV